MFAPDKGGDFLRRPAPYLKRDQKLFVTESPMSCGSVAKTFVVKLVSALFRRASEVTKGEAARSAREAFRNGQSRTSGRSGLGAHPAELDSRIAISAESATDERSTLLPRLPCTR